MRGRSFGADPAASHDGSDPARTLLRELPILRLPDDALESVWNATVRARTEAGRRRRIPLAIVAGVAAAAAVLVVGFAATRTLDRGDASPEDASPVASMPVAEADGDSIRRAELGVRFAFGVTERALERFPVLNLLKTTFSSERKR